MGTVRSSVPPLRNAVTVFRNGGTDSLHFKKRNGPSNFRYISGPFPRYNLVRSSVPPFLRYFQLSERAGQAQGFRTDERPGPRSHRRHICAGIGWPETVTETSFISASPPGHARVGRTCDTAGGGVQLVTSQCGRRFDRFEAIIHANNGGRPGRTRRHDCVAHRGR